MEEVTFDPSKVCQHGLAYTALSHARKIESLYLTHKLQHTNFKVSHKLKNEMQRLYTTAQWIMNYNVPAILETRHIICSLNTRSLALHKEDIAHDHTLLAATVLCLQETRTTHTSHMTLLTKNFN